jgi:hypothetical protein
MRPNKSLGRNSADAFIFPRRREQTRTQRLNPSVLLKTTMPIG